MLKEFKAFISKGNVIDLAVAVILATYFGAIIKSLVKDVIMPPIGKLMGGVDFAEASENDGTRVAVSIVDEEGSDIFLWDLRRSRLTQLTLDAAVDDYPLWTPDDSGVVFRSGREGGGLFLKSADGTGRARRLLDGADRRSRSRRDRRKCSCSHPR